MAKLTIISSCCGTRLRRYGCSGPLVLAEEDGDEPCCCSGCFQVAIKIPGVPDGTTLNGDWPGIAVNISGPVTYYGDYFGAPKGFWQGSSAAGNAPSSVSLTFNEERPAKIIVICTAMNTGESQSWSVSGDASVEVSDVTPAGAYIAGPRGNSGTITRADAPGNGESRFYLVVKQSFPGSITGFDWSHSTQNNQNGMVNAIFVCGSVTSSLSLG
jgi:hypothetical protein